MGGDARLFPQTAIVDPELMTSVPPTFTAYQGFDALFHSVEAYIAKSASLMSDMYALTAIENIGGYLARAVENGKDAIAREKMLEASFFAASSVFFLKRSKNFFFFGSGGMPPRTLLISVI